MNESTSSLRSELQLSPRWVLVAMPIVGALLYIGTQTLLLPWETVDRMGTLLLLLSGLAGVGWLITVWRAAWGRWAAILAAVAAPFCTGLWMQIPAALTLAAIPVGLAVPLIGLAAAVTTAVLESAVVIGLLLAAPHSVIDPSIGVVTLVGIWAMVAVAIATRRPTNQLAEWLDEYFRQAQEFLLEAQDRKQELERALEGLAHANRQLALANERTAALRQIAEEAQRAKTTFVANVSHEFRTPLNMIIGLVDLMVESPEIYTVAPSPKMREDLEVVHRNCEHLSNMINDVLDLTRMEAGRLLLHRERVDLRRIVDRSVTAVSPLLNKKGLALDVRVPAELPEVYCDRVRIQQVILNLMSNAARFTEVGGISVTVLQEDHSVVVSVADTGPGISPEDKERIFEPFSQGRSELWRDSGGSGLGLSISEQFVKLHGGRMWLESEPGVGTTFFFTLPVSPPIEHVARPGHHIRSDWEWREGAFLTSRPDSVSDLVRPCIAVYDPVGALYPEFAHQGDAIEFVQVSDLDDLRETLEQCPSQFVLFNALEKEDLRAAMKSLLDVAPATPVILCEAPRPAERALEAGARGHLTKPVTRADLERAIEAVGDPVQRVLVVDDDPDVLQLLTRMLHACDRGLDVEVASNGAQALAEVQTGAFDLILLDIVMPDLDGWRVLDEIVRSQSTDDVPVFFLSAQDPADEPLATPFFLMAIDRGLTLNELLRCSVSASRTLLKLGEAPDLMLQ
ncbi:MAG: response regulator [Chloroflexi bacterium]|nr:response regulator [Chloroflexota bacterium]